MKPFRIELIPEYFMDILPYIRVTFNVLLVALLFGVILGAAVAAGKLSKHRALRGICVGFTTVMRCVPTVVLLFVVYYGIPALLKGLGIDGNKIGIMVYTIITFSLISGNELSEVMRSSYEAVPKGQYEAGVSTGLSGMQTFRRIMLPQAFKIAIPNLGNTVILLFKETSIAYIIGLLDIMGKANIINQQTWGVHAIEVYIAVSIIYWAISIIFEQLIKLYERRLSKNERTSQPKMAASAGKGDN